MTNKPPRTCKATPDFSNLPCKKLSNAKAIVKPHLANDFTGSCAGTAAVAGSMQTGVAGETVCQVTVRLPMPI